MEQIKSNKSHKFKIETWESNKGHELGYMAWGLYVSVPELAMWYKLDGSHRNYPLNPVDCERIAMDSFNHALAGGYQDVLRLVFGDEYYER